MSAATSAQPVVDSADAVGAAAVVGAVAAVVGLGWLGVELVLQLVKMQSKATAVTPADADRRAW